MIRVWAEVWPHEIRAVAHDLDWSVTGMVGCCDTFECGEKGGR
jgi:hypothetical protein